MKGRVLPEEIVIERVNEALARRDPGGKRWDPLEERIVTASRNFSIVKASNGPNKRALHLRGEFYFARLTVSEDGRILEERFEKGHVDLEKIAKKLKILGPKDKMKPREGPCSNKIEPRDSAKIEPSKKTQLRFQIFLHESKSERIAECRTAKDALAITSSRKTITFLHEQRRETPPISAFRKHKLRYEVFMNHQRRRTIAKCRDLEDAVNLVARRGQNHCIKAFEGNKIVWREGPDEAWSARERERTIAECKRRIVYG